MSETEHEKKKQEHETESHVISLIDPLSSVNNYSNGHEDYKNYRPYTG